ncbi:hypothetical protein BAY61_32200 (plasmid) [Prauserella marina]|nr:hypothetical protein [Prauserella marina]ASR39946.1 hypothetical protein BAY61_32200 [Prauserella marina]
MPIISTFCAADAVGDAAGEVVGDAASDAAASVATSAFDKVAESAGAWAGDLLVRAMTWWVQTPTVNPDTDAVRIAQSWTIPIAITILMVSLLWQCIRLVLSNRKDPLVNIATGLVRYVVIVTVGLSVLAGAITAGDALSQAMIGETARNFGVHMQEMLTREVIQNPFGLLMIGLLLALVAFFQWILGFLRQAGILILAAMIPLAASGSLNEGTKPWWPRLATAAIALVVYKPMAAFIYMLGFTFIGEGRDLGTVMVGMMILILSLFALPALMRFFSWAETSIGARAGGGGGLATGAAMIAAGAAARSGGRASAPAMAGTMTSTGPGTGAGNSGTFGMPGGSRTLDRPTSSSGNGDSGVGAASGAATTAGAGADHAHTATSTPSGAAPATGPAGSTMAGTAPTSSPSGARATGAAGAAASGGTSSPTGSRTSSTGAAGAAGALQQGYQAGQAAANEVTRGATPPASTGDDDTRKGKTL